MKRLLIVITAALAAFAFMITGANAATAVSTGRSDACNSYACGSGTFTSTDAYTLKGAMSVKLTCGKGQNLAAIKIIVEGVDGKQQSGAQHTIGKCGQLTLFSNLTWHQASAIRWWRVLVNSTNGQGPSGYHETYGNLVYP
ncbi:hypothetical protein ABZ721_30715 [Streptomyces sp. NPDC006733]|uniref:hypothetical protein n=1 Tax=Streptomyces sp. NPDC006733 TaxID=3155460 RepID=UPI0033E331A4